MLQMPLNILSYLPYASRTFVVHAGVKQAYLDCIALMSTKGFRLAYVVGETRFGKTHFSVKLSDALLERGLNVSLIDGVEVPKFVSEARAVFSRNTVVVIDNAHEYLMSLEGNGQGHFVDFIETLRGVGAGVVFVSDRPVKDFNLDGHVKSRLNPGVGLFIGAPGPDDFVAVFQALAKQRGLELSYRKVSVLQKRLRHDIPSMEAFLQRAILLSDIEQESFTFPLLAEAFDN